jgi:hypothetical protein
MVSLRHCQQLRDALVELRDLLGQRLMRFNDTRKLLT